MCWAGTVDVGPCGGGVELRMRCSEVGEDVCWCGFWQSVLPESSSIPGELLECRLECGRDGRVRGACSCCQLLGVCIARSFLGSSIWDHHKTGDGGGEREGVVMWALVLEFFSPLSFSISSVFSPSSPLLCSPCLFLTLLFSSQLVQYNKASSRMEGDCALLSLPVAQDSRDSCPDTAASPIIGSVAGPPQDPAPPDQCASGAEKPQLDKQDPTGGPLSQDQMPKTPEQECMIDSQPILFSENPFVVANRKGKAAGKACLGGPPLGYGRGGVLKTNLYSKASSPMACCVWRALTQSRPPVSY